MRCNYRHTNCRQQTSIHVYGLVKTKLKSRDFCCFDVGPSYVNLYSDSLTCENVFNELSSVQTETQKLSCILISCFVIKIV